MRLLNISKGEVRYLIDLNNQLIEDVEISDTYKDELEQSNSLLQGILDNAPVEDDEELRESEAE